MPVEVKNVDQAQNKLEEDAIQYVIKAMEKLDAIPAMIPAAAEAGEGLYGALPPTKSGKQALVTHSGKGLPLLDSIRFSIGPVSIEGNISRTITYESPEYYKFLVDKGFAFIWENQLPQSVVDAISIVMK